MFPQPCSSLRGRNALNFVYLKEDHATETGFAQGRTNLLNEDGKALVALPDSIGFHFLLTRVRGIRLRALAAWAS